jgi:hypothetical protein
MKRILALIIMAMILATSFACSSKKPPEPAAIRTKSALSVLRDLNRAYEKKDLAAFMAGVSPSYRDREAFEKTLSSVFAKYETIRFDIQFSKMIIMIDSINQAKATFTWEGEWRAAGGLYIKDGARVTLIFEQKDNKLVAIEGKNPFIPQPGTTPGK